LDANFVTINTERAQPVPWKNKSLQEEKLSRITVRSLVSSGTIVAVVALLFLFITHVAAVTMRPNLTKAQQETSAATEKLMYQAAQATRNEADRHLFRIQELLLALANINGTLLRYEFVNGQTKWQALIPPAAGGTGLESLRATVVGSSPDGRVKIQGSM
jgi:hypothetical protein